MRAITLAIVFTGSLCLATPASADFCLQMSGGLSGDLGFFRFRGKLPKKAGNIEALHGRVAGLSPAFGTAIRAKDDSYTEVGASRPFLLLSLAVGFNFSAFFLYILSAPMFLSTHNRL